MLDHLPTSLVQIWQGQLDPFQIGEVAPLPGQDGAVGLVLIETLAILASFVGFNKNLEIF